MKENDLVLDVNGRLGVVRRVLQPSGDLRIAAVEVSVVGGTVGGIEQWPSGMLVRWFQGNAL
jgi:hypothetical protein